jgi:hypothetical protein
LRESTLAVGAGGSGQSVVARSKIHLDRKRNLKRLAESFNDISAKDYMERALDILADEI